MTTLIDCLNAARTTVGDTYDLDEEVLQNIYDIFVKECKPLIDAKPVKAARASKKSSDSKPSKPRAMTAYNLYVRHQFALSKSEPPKEGEVSNSQTRMKTFSSQWKELTDEEKKPYEQMAKDAIAEATAASEAPTETAQEAAPVVKPDVKESKPKAKAGKSKADPAPASEKPKPAKKEKDPNAKKRVTGYNLFYSDNKDRIKSELQKGEKIMQVVGAAWKELSEEEQQEYNDRAKAANSSDSDASQAE